ncbi:MAG: hypothetical protein HC886_04490 [Leptolyngbyaceae cyanobacterium SM1_1_3]|nr:hypothetical protein [Leptolyngbyaceae cyanobacterium SM1_1_3]NJM85155.1 hypothetical protein [Leptolyngbyaceae cyanobacterium RM2_2_21]NJN02163.1 hypothetical protein [Leptolyngbyaceae cyanobacterium RM1_1_2]NJO08955.1 hypothetical protein [Leptolyngbyaceae cyanobacterium SL_1_1]
MNYLVAVLSDRSQAEAAYAALEQANFSPDSTEILGKGYRSAEEYGLIDPKQKAWNQIKLMALWLVPFGFIAGLSFNAVTGLDTFSWAGRFGNQLLGGLLGAASGGLGSFMVGGGSDVVLGSSDAMSYRDRLDTGKYLVAVKGSEAQINRANRIVRQFDPENIQGYQGE